MWKPLQWLYCIYAVVLFIVLMIPVFIWSLFALTQGRIKGGNLVYGGCRVWAALWFPLIFIRHRNIFEQPLDAAGSYIFVANHISYLDAAIIPNTFRQPVRPLGKVELSKIPIFGFIYKNTIVTVDRSSSGNRSKSVQLLKSILRKGISVLVFPEGTFNTTGRPVKEFYDGAFRIAIETGTPIRPVLFLDTFHRMHYSSLFSLTPGRNRCIFLEEVPVAGYSLKQTKQLRDKVQLLMQEKLKEYDAAWIKDETVSERSE